MEKPDPNREHDVETPVSEVEVLEPHHQELGRARNDCGGIAARRNVDHLRRAIDGGQSAVAEQFSDHRGGHTMAAADLEDMLAGANVELIDDGQPSTTSARLSTTDARIHPR